MKYFKTITQFDLINIIKSTKHELFLSLPSFHKEIADAIMSIYSTKSDKKVGIHIVVDFDSQTFRQGYGDIQSVEQLIREGLDVKKLKDNRISFFISDDKGYYLFIESRSLIPADKETINAVKVDPVSIVRLKQFFFSNSIKINYKDELTNAVIEEGLLLDKTMEMQNNQIAPVTELSEKEIHDVSKDLENNPPLNPDFKRVVEFYSNKFQYVKLKFIGSNLQHRKIEIPPEVLPSVDKELRKRLDTKLNLFDPKFINETFSSILELKTEVSAIRDKYLKKVKSREESLLNKLKKNDFEAAIEKLRKKIKEVKDENLNNIAKQINSTIESLDTYLYNFYKENPKYLLRDHQNIIQYDENNIDNYSKNKAKKIIYILRWPNAYELLDELKIDLQYSDITYEDLKNKKFISELVECGLIDVDDEKELASFGIGIETVRN
jgi:hypothetical protein